MQRAFLSTVSKSALGASSVIKQTVNPVKKYVPFQIQAPPGTQSVLVECSEGMQTKDNYSENKYEKRTILVQRNDKKWLDVPLL